MRVVLIKPPFNGFNSQIVQMYPPLGILYLVAALKNSGFSADFLDFLNEYNFRRIAKVIKDTEADIYGISVLTGNRYEADIITDIIKQYHPRARVVLGGIHVSALYKDILAYNNNIDGVFLSESEYSLPIYAANPDRKDKVPGFAYRQGSEIRTSPPNIVNNIDTLPMPFLTSAIVERYKNSVYSRLVNSSFNFHNGINYHIITGRGCAYSCNFCAQRAAAVPVRLHSAGRVVEEMKRAKYFLDDVNILFHDENFMVNSERTIKLCDAIQKSRLRVGWNIRTRPELLKYDLLSMMKASGLRSIFFGVESGSSKVLDRMNKKLPLDSIKRAFKIAKRAGVRRHCNIIVGYPGEDKQDVRRTAALLREINPDSISFSVPRIYPGTVLCSEAYSNNVIKPSYWRDKKNKSIIPVYYNSSILSLAITIFRVKLSLNDTLPEKIMFVVYSTMKFVVKTIIRIYNYFNCKL